MVDLISQLIDMRFLCREMDIRPANSQSMSFSSTRSETKSTASSPSRHSSFAVVLPYHFRVNAGLLFARCQRVHRYDRMLPSPPALPQQQQRTCRILLDAMHTIIRRTPPNDADIISKFSAGGWFLCQHGGGCDVPTVGVTVHRL